MDTFLLLHICFVLFTTKELYGEQIVPDECLGCLCEAASECNLKAGCDGNVCGPFRITWAFWADSGKPSIMDQANNDNAYTECALNLTCSARAIEGYMNRFKTDCNGDQKIDCDDFVLIHKFGGYGCQNAKFEEDDKFHQRYKECRRAVSQAQNSQIANIRR